MTGLYTYLSDRKCRVVVPAPFREMLGAPLVLTRDAESLLLTARATWDWLERRAPARVRAAAVEVRPCATTGRVLVPAVLREPLGLRPFTEVAWAGQGPVVVGQVRRDAAHVPEAPLWLRGEEPARLVSVDRGTALLALDLLGSVKGRAEEVAVVMAALARGCGDD